MSVIASLAQIRVCWLQRASDHLSHGEGIRESFLLQLQRFFDLLILAVDSKDVERLDPLLEDWIIARTQTELESAETSLPPILEQLFQFVLSVGHEILDPNDVLALIDATLPAYAHAIEYSARKETNLHVEHMARELEKTKNVLERLDKSKSDFIGIAAHELKTPLTLIKGYTEMLYDQIKPTQGSSTKVLLQGIENGVSRLQEILDDMIDVSMIDNNLLSVHFQPVWLFRILNTVQGEFAKILKERRQTLIVRSFPGSNELTFGDESRLCQVFRNVINNGIKFTPDGGEIIVDGRILPGFVEVTVADTGIGIAIEDQVRIFDKFGQLGDVSLHSSGKTKFKGGGPGLGLPIAKGIIEAHGGAIWVESEGYNEIILPGAIFHILLPIRKEPPDDKIARLFRGIVEVDQYGKEDS
jgi:signal transduction histidine kinase